MPKADTQGNFWRWSATDWRSLTKFFKLKAGRRLGLSLNKLDSVSESIHIWAERHVVLTLPRARGEPTVLKERTKFNPFDYANKVHER